MGKFRDWLRELNELNEIKINYLDDIKTKYGVITWNNNKSFNKLKSQIEDIIKAGHLPDSEKLHALIQKVMNKYFEDFYLGGTSEEDDTCIGLSRSQFVIVFNAGGKFIRSIRKYSDLDKLMCHTKSRIFEVKYGIDNELVQFILENDVDLNNETEYGYKFTDIIQENEVMFEVTKTCRVCLQIDL